MGMIPGVAAVASGGLDSTTTAQLQEAFITAQDIKAVPGQTVAAGKVVLLNAADGNDIYKNPTSNPITLPTGTLTRVNLEGVGMVRDVDPVVINEVQILTAAPGVNDTAPSGVKFAILAPDRTFRIGTDSKYSEMIKSSQRALFSTQAGTTKNAPTSTAHPNPATGDTHIVGYADGSRAFWTYDTAWTQAFEGSAVQRALSTHRQNATISVAPTSTEHPSPVLGDGHTIVLTNGNTELWSYGSAWTLVHTIEAQRRTTNVIARTNATIGVAPNATEYPSPVNGDVAYIGLNNGITETHVYTGGAWYHAVPSLAASNMTPATTTADGVSGLVPGPTKAQVNSVFTGHGWDVLQITGRYIGSAATFATLPTTSAATGAAVNGDWASLSADVVGTGTAGNPQYPKGVYIYNGTAYSFAFALASSAGVLTQAQAESSTDTTAGLITGERIAQAIATRNAPDGEIVTGTSTVPRLRTAQQIRTEVSTIIRQLATSNWDAAFAGYGAPNLTGSVAGNLEFTTRRGITYRALTATVPVGSDPATNTTNWAPTINVSASGAGAWVALTAVNAGDLRVINYGITMVILRSKSSRTTGAALDVTEFVNWDYVGQTEFHDSFPANTAIPFGFKLYIHNQSYEAGANRVTGASWATAGEQDWWEPISTNCIRYLWNGSRVINKELREGNVNGIFCVMMSQWDGTYTDPWDATDAANFVVIRQASVPGWSASTAYPSGFRIKQDGTTWTRNTGGASGTVWNDTEKAAWLATTDFSAVKTRFSATVGSGQAVATATTTTITGWTAAGADTTGFNANGTFTAPRDGMYIISYQLTFNGTNGTTATAMSINIVGLNLRTALDVPPNRDFTLYTPTFTHTVNMTAGQAITFQCWQGFGANLSVSVGRLSVVEL